MSKQSKITSTHNYFGICLKNRPNSQSIEPSSAEKGRSFYQTHKGQINCKDSKKKPNTNEFYLQYREKAEKNQLISLYRIKSMICPVINLKAQNLRDFKVLGTYDKKIILGFNPKLNLFCFFDQHAMHERIRYEYYIEYLMNYELQNQNAKDWDCSVIQKQGKQIKVISKIKHSYMSYKVTKQVGLQLEEDSLMKKYGFQVQYIKEQSVIKITRIPDILERTLDDQLIVNIAYDIVLGKTKFPKCFESVVAEISCKSAYKFNDLLNTQTIGKLIRNLSLCQYPFFCVHGRPTLFTKT